jgi:hypothetical protein
VSGGDSAVALAPTLSWAPPLRSQPDVSPNQLDTKEKKNEKIKRERKKDQILIRN